MIFENKSSAFLEDWFSQVITHMSGKLHLELDYGQKTLTSRTGRFRCLIETTPWGFREILKQQRRGRIAQRSLKVRSKTKGVKMRTSLDIKTI